jgi:hypothetical protein
LVILGFQPLRGSVIEFIAFPLRCKDRLEEEVGDGIRRDVAGSRTWPHTGRTQIEMKRNSEVDRNLYCADENTTVANLKCS